MLYPGLALVNAFGVPVLCNATCPLYSPCARYIVHVSAVQSTCLRYSSRVCGTVHVSAVQSNSRRMRLKTSRAAVLTNYEAPLELKHFPLPAVEPGGALVKVKLAGICGTDVHLWHGQLPIPLPVILGHETVGIIEEIGAGLKQDWSGKALSAGDRVTWSSSINCGECYYWRVKTELTRCLHRK